MILDLQNLVDLGALFLAYFITIIGWIGYHKSITLRPHTGTLGNMRFAVDLFIVFLVYYLIRLAGPSSKAPYGDTFIWLIPALFLTYLVWDTIKFFEYRNQSDEKRIKLNRLTVTAFFTGVFLIAGITYYFIAPTLPTITQNFWNSEAALNLSFIIFSLIITIIYRARKWEVEREFREHSI